MGKIAVKTTWLGLPLVFLTTILFVLILPRLLVLDDMTNSDYIAVLDGHDANFYEGLRLLRGGVAKRMFVCLDLPDVPLNEHEIQEDLEFIEKTAGPLAPLIDVCKSDYKDSLTELGDIVTVTGARRVLIVTPAAESRATYILATRRYPRLSWSVHATADRGFDVRWWRSRDQAETYFNAIARLAAAVIEPRSRADSREASQSNGLP